ncbi:MAG: Hsp33 family molecular chaperone HslO [Clostridiales bacterium]|nr:Hsp33 family molecular chaperone HslO [Clostridiales bacterium]
MNNTVIAVDPGGSYRLYLTVTTEMVQEAKNIHKTTNLATAALGRVLTGAGLMGLMLKDEDSTLTVQVKGDGPGVEILASADGRGRVKGYIADPDVELPLKADGKLDVGGAVGKGTLTVIKDLKLKEPYLGRIDLVSGEIAEDLAHYFLLSEQQPSSVALGVRIGPDLNVQAAGGMILQILPGAQEACLDALEERIAALGSLTEHIPRIHSPAELMDRILGDLPPPYRPRVLEERNIRWHCGCSEERMEKALISIGEKDLEQLIREDGGAEIVCQFCLGKYQFDRKKMEALLREARHE